MRSGLISWLITSRKALNKLNQKFNSPSKSKPDIKVNLNVDGTEIRGGGMLDIGHQHLTVR